jgi:hypothetical protein
MSFCLCVCLYVYLPACLYVCLFACRSARLSVYPPGFLSVCLPTVPVFQATCLNYCLSVCQSASPSVLMCVRLFICLPICKSAGLSVWWSVSVCVCLSSRLSSSHSPRLSACLFGCTVQYFCLFFVFILFYIPPESLPRTNGDRNWFQDHAAALHDRQLTSGEFRPRIPRNSLQIVSSLFCPTAVLLV